jgi:hypothetical protein
LKKQASVTSPSSEFNPFGGSSNGTAHKQPQQQQSNQNDLFGLDLSGMGSAAPPPMNGNHTGNSGANDLLSLNGPNPFMNSMVTQQAYNMQPLPMVNNPFGSPAMQQQQQPMNLFQSAPGNNFNSANKMSKLKTTIIKYYLYFLSRM